jgi:outer membrane autotransporter protein
VFGSRNGSQVFGSLTAGYEFKRESFLLSPYARINAAWITLDAFTETGGLGGALNFSDQSANFVTSVLGFRGRYTMLTPWGALTPRFRVEYNHDFNNASSVSLRYADFITGPVFGLSVAPAERDRVTLGLGSDFAFSEALRLGADYQYNSDFLGAAWHTFKLKLQSRF